QRHHRRPGDIAVEYQLERQGGHHVQTVDDRRLLLLPYRRSTQRTSQGAVQLQRIRRRRHLHLPQRVDETDQERRQVHGLPVQQWQPLDTSPVQVPGR